MAENSKIEWTDHTFNPWWGCAKVSPGCDNCYAERDAGRFSTENLWGADAKRRTFGDKHWNEPLKWERRYQHDMREWVQLAASVGGRDEAIKRGMLPPERPRVFCASMADVFDKNAPDGARERLWDLIKATPSLDWLLLTKRIGNATKMLPADWGDGYPNVWLGASIVNQEEADRDIPKLLAVPTAVRFLSMEPLLGPVDLTKIKRREDSGRGDPENTDCWTYYDDVLAGFRAHKCGGVTDKRYALDWVIVGGESGPYARPMHPDWARSLRDQCAAAGVPFLFKQWGEWGAWDATAQTAGKESACVGYTWMWRVGKKAAGRLLDGRTHDEFPRSKSCTN